MITEIQTKTKELLSALYDLNRQVSVGMVEMSDRDVRSMLSAIAAASDIETWVEDIEVKELK